MRAIDRIYKYIDNKGYSVAEFERLSSISNGYLSKMKRRSAGVGEDILNSILENCPDLSPEWLLTGNGEMLRSEEKKFDLPVAHHSLTDGIPLIPIDAMAGWGAGDMPVLEYECEFFVVPLFRDAEFLIQVRGDSMQPRYLSGDIVACKKLPLTDLFFQWNKIYVLDTVQGALIKRVKPGSDDKHILVISDNPDYDQFELPYDAIRSVALVIGGVVLE